MDVFVTGATGYVGRHVTAALRDRGHHVVGLARSEESAADLRELGAEPRRGRLQQTDVLRDAARAADAVVHLAADDDPHQAVAVDREAVAAMLDAASGDTPVPFVYPSDVVVYGDTDEPASESRTPDTDTHRWLVRQERRVVRAHRDGIRPFVLRLSMVYGDRGGFVRTLVNVAHEHDAIPVFADEPAEWCTVHVADAADLIAWTLTADRDAAGVYNVATDHVPMAAVADRLSHALDYPTWPVSVEEFADLLPMDPEAADALAADLAKRILVDTTKLEALDWQPTRASLLDYGQRLDS